MYAYSENSIACLSGCLVLDSLIPLAHEAGYVVVHSVLRNALHITASIKSEVFCFITPYGVVVIVCIPYCSGALGD